MNLISKTCLWIFLLSKNPPKLNLNNWHFSHCLAGGRPHIFTSQLYSGPLTETLANFANTSGAVEICCGEYGQRNSQQPGWIGWTQVGCQFCASPLERSTRTLGPAQWGTIHSAYGCRLPIQTIGLFCRGKVFFVYLNFQMLWQALSKQFAQIQFGQPPPAFQVVCHSLLGPRFVQTAHFCRTCALPSAQKRCKNCKVPIPHF